MRSRTTRYILDIACAAHVRAYRGTCTTGYRLLFIGPYLGAGAVAGRDVARRSPPRRSQEQASINSHECAWFVRETTFSYERDTIRACAKYAVFLVFLRIVLQIERTPVSFKSAEFRPCAKYLVGNFQNEIYHCS